MDNTQQLPADVVAEIKAYAKSYVQNFTFPHFWDETTEELALPVIEQVHEEIATEYATKLHQVETEIEDKANEIERLRQIVSKHKSGRTHQEQKAAIENMRALLQKFISRHEAGLLPDQFLYEEIKKFLDGTK